MPHKVLFISRSGQSIGYGTNPASEHGDRAFNEDLSRRSGLGFDCPVRHLFPAGAPLPAASSSSNPAPFPTRAEGGVYGQVAAWFDSGGSLHSPAKEATHQRSDGRGLVDFPAKEAPWLSPTLRVTFVSSLPLATTATLRRSWQKFTGCWSPAWTCRDHPPRKQAMVTT
jgi:hypothetical protein